MLVEGNMAKASRVLPLAVFGALLGFQSGASAGPLPLATGSMEFDVCSFGGTCEFETPSIQFPPNPNMQTVNGPNTGNGSSVGTGTIGFQPPSSSAQTPTTQIAGYLTGYPSSTLDVLFTYDFEFMALNGTGPSLAPAELSAMGGVQASAPSDVSGDAASASVTITDISASTPLTVFSACAILGPVSIASCGFGTVMNPFNVSPSLNLTPGDIYSLQLEISIAFDDSAAPVQDQNVNGSIDPTITNADPSDFQLLVSPNLVTTPLPSTWITMLIGLAGLGLVAYRRQKQRSVAA
jgi:hypothetical protein